MHMNSMKVIGRATAALALGAAITMSTAALAGADGSGHWGHDVASARVSPFDYADNGTGGDVTAVTATSVTIQLWGGSSATFALTSATTYSEGSKSTTWSSLVVGDRVRIGVSSTSSTTATSVSIELAELFGTVKSVSGDTILITDPQGFTRTILVSSATTYNQGSSSDVVAGAKIFAQGTVDANGTTLDALTIDVGTAGQNGFTWGKITAVTSSSVTLVSGSGTSTTFSYTTDTTVKALSHDPITLTSADLVVGEYAGVEFNSTASTTAVEVWVKLAHVSGVVTAVSGDNITVSDHQGFTHLILVGDATTYDNAGATGSLTDVIVGAHIRAEGLVDANGTTLDALNIDICSTKTTPSTQFTSIGHVAPHSGPQSFGHGHGGHHRGGGDGGFGRGAEGQNFRSNRF
jgi:Domain of unknown function (DUF5666)